MPHNFDFPTIWQDFNYMSGLNLDHHKKNCIIRKIESTALSYFFHLMSFMKNSVRVKSGSFLLNYAPIVPCSLLLTASQESYLNSFYMYVNNSLWKLYVFSTAWLFCKGQRLKSFWHSGWFSFFSFIRSASVVFLVFLALSCFYHQVPKTSWNNSIPD